jgi:general secretion pathway protein B
MHRGPRMSLILDALKKSEAERMRGQAPNVLSPLPSMPSQKQVQIKSGLPWMIVIALLIAILVIIFFNMKEKAVGTPGAVPVPTDQAPAAESAEPTIKVFAPEVTTPIPEPVEKPLPPVAAVSPPAKQAPEEMPVPNQAPALVNEPEPAARIASLSEMSAEQRQQLPTLKLSMHVYSTEASKRFAIIDGQRVNEGSVLGSALIEQIRQDGVVLSVQGQSYLLPRP